MNIPALSKTPHYDLISNINANGSKTFYIGNNSCVLLYGFGSGGTDFFVTGRTNSAGSVSVIEISKGVSITITKATNSITFANSNSNVNSRLFAVIFAGVFAEQT